MFPILNFKFNLLPVLLAQEASSKGTRQLRVGGIDLWACLFCS